MESWTNVWACAYNYLLFYVDTKTKVVEAINAKVADQFIGCK